MVAAAAEQATRPLAFLEQRDFFDDLAEDERFSSSYLRVMRSLHKHGARLTLENLDPPEQAPVQL